MLYDTSLILTYNYYDRQFIDFNNQQNIDLSIIESDDMTEEVSDMLYKTELVGVFGLTEFDEDIINSKINELCTVMSKHEEFTKLMKHAAGKLLCEDLSVGLMVLFSYHSFFLVHRCICDFLTTSSIQSNHLNNLIIVK